MSKAVTLYEVGPRDGLKNEPHPITVQDKLRLIDLLSWTGLQNIEVGSFVSPKWVPQMADSNQIVAQLPNPDLNHQVLIPNIRGLEAFFAAVRDVTDPPDEIAIFVSASEGFSKANLNCSIDKSFDRLMPVVDTARENGLLVRSYISCVVACPFDGPTKPDDVARVAKRLADYGLTWQSLGDTIGDGTPDTVTPMMQAVMDVVPVQSVAGHFHDTGGQALDNIDACLALGGTGL